MLCYTSTDAEVIEGEPSFWFLLEEVETQKLYHSGYEKLKKENTKNKTK